MTWSHGYMCPVCECRWVAHLCKDRKLPCGCNVKTEDAVYIYVWYAGRRGKNICIRYKDINIDEWCQRGEHPEEELKKLIKGHPAQKLLEKAVENAIYGRSLYHRDWITRCSKCSNFIPFEGTAYDITHSMQQWRKKCKIHDWCSIDCEDFRKEEIDVIRA